MDNKPDVSRLLIEALELLFPVIPNDSTVVADPGRLGFDHEDDIIQAVFAGRTWKDPSPEEIDRSVGSLPLFDARGFERSIPAFLRGLVLGQITDAGILMYYLRRCVVEASDEGCLLYPGWWAGLSMEQRLLIAFMVVWYAKRNFHRSQHKEISAIWIPVILDLA
jgi:hypothetical protein